MNSRNPAELALRRLTINLVVMGVGALASGALLAEWLLRLRGH